MKRKKFESAIAEFIAAVTLLIRRVRATTAAHQLSLAESSVLSRLAEGGPATTAALARGEAVKPQSMGATLAALEKLEFIERRPDATDGRRVNIRLTHKGDAYRKSIKDAKRSWLAQAIEQLDERDQDTLFEAAEIIKRLASSDV